MIFWLIALACLIPAAWVGGTLNGEASASGRHNVAVAGRRFEVPSHYTTYNAQTGRHEIAEHGRHREERENTRWLLIGEAPAREEVFGQGAR